VTSEGILRGKQIKKVIVVPGKLVNIGGVTRRASSGSNNVPADTTQPIPHRSRRSERAIKFTYAQMMLNACLRRVRRDVLDRFAIELGRTM